MQQTGGFHKEIQGLWVSGELSAMEQMCIQSFLNCGHDFILYTYGEVSGIPVGTTVRDARTVLAESELDRFLKKFNNQLSAGFSDLFRYHMLHQNGGWWVDMDVVCRKPFHTVTPMMFASTYEYGWGSPATGCVMTYQPDSEISRWFVTEAEKLVDETPEGVMGLAIGPFLVQRAVRELKLEAYVAPWWQFNPYFWKGMNRVVYPNTPMAWVKDVLRRVKQRVIALKDKTRPAPYIRSRTWAVHLYNDIWKPCGLNKRDRFHPWCIYEQFRKELLSDLQTMPPVKHPPLNQVSAS